MTDTREKMVKDLIDSDTIIGMNTIELIQSKIERFLIDVIFEKNSMVTQDGKTVIMTRTLDTVHVEPNEDGSLPDRKPAKFYKGHSNIANWKEGWRNRKIFYPVAKAYGKKVNYKFDKVFRS